MREAQDSASEPIAYSRVTKGGLPKLKPGTVNHIMKPPRPHRGVGTTQHRPAARPRNDIARGRARPAQPPPLDGITSAARGRPPPHRDTGRSQPPAAPDADQLSQFSACRAHRQADRGPQPAPQSDGGRTLTTPSTSDAECHHQGPPTTQTGYRPPTTKQEPQHPADCTRCRSDKEKI